MDAEQITAYYDGVFEDSGYAAYRPKEAYTPYIDQLRHQSGALLDIGCGSGHLLKIAEEQGFDPYGIDISGEAISLCETYVDGVFEQAAAEDIPFDDGAFDAVTCIGVLEHAVDPAAVLDEAKRVASPDAEFLFVVPNKKFLLWRLTREGTEQQEIREELRTWAGWRRLFEENGFTVLGVHRDGWHLKFGGLKRFAAGLINRMIPLNHNYQFVIRLEANDA